MEPNVHRRLQNVRPDCYILDQLNPIHTLKLYFFNTRVHKFRALVCRCYYILYSRAWYFWILIMEHNSMQPSGT